MRENSRPRSSRSRHSSAGTAAALLTVGGLAAAFGVAACCGLPLMLTALGLGSVSFVGIAFLAAPYRSPLLVLAAVCLGAGALLLWRQRGSAATCVPGIARFHRAFRLVTVIALVLGMIMLALGYAYA